MARKRKQDIYILDIAKSDPLYKYRKELIGLKLKRFSFLYATRNVGYVRALVALYAQDARKINPRVFYDGVSKISFFRLSVGPKEESSPELEAFDELDQESDGLEGIKLTPRPRRTRSRRRTSSV